MTGQTAQQDEITQVANALLQPKGLRLASYKILQRLWAGYGNICHIHAVSIQSEPEDKKHSFILKHVTPPTVSTDPEPDEGHFRKLISYQVEQYFYTRLAPSMPSDVSVAQCVGSVNERAKDGNNTIALVLTDLREQFPVAGERRSELEEKQVFAALKWLATFHGFWLTRTHEIRKENLRLPPLEEARLTTQGTDGVWLNGGYTYLATRRKEYAALKEDSSSEWSSALCEPFAGTNRSIAEFVAQVLAPAQSRSAKAEIAQYETLIHGDVKSENLFTDMSGSTVAFFDFQYVGLGLGVCDLAKLFTCSVPLSMLMKHGLEGTDGEALGMSEPEQRLLGYYSETIHVVSGKEYSWENLEMHWTTALVDWLRFQASWGFWGNTEWLEARVRYILKDKRWLEWLLRVAEGHQI